MPEYPISEEVLAEMRNKHTYHAPTPEQVARYEKIRQAAYEFERIIRENSPSSRPQSVAITHLETATFWANAAIARHE